MKLADIMRDIADLLDQKMGQDSAGADMSSNSTHKRMGDVEVEKPEEAEQSTMVPPLQAKIEILKKSEGLPNVYDDGKAGDELAAIKKNAGISTAQQEASDDNPLDM